jgi:uncharacterized protein YPO0396
MDYENIKYLKDYNPTVKLLRFDNAPLILSFLFQEFKQYNKIVISNIELKTSLSDYLYNINHIYGENTYPSTSQNYLDKWSNDKFDVKEKIEGLKRNYENLTKSYEAVQIAKKQLQQLQPLIQEADEFEKASIEIQELRSCLNSLPIYFAIQKAKLLQEEIKSLNEKLGVISNQIEEIRIDLERLRNKESEVKIAIDNNKEGQRLKLIENEIKELERIKQDKLNKEIEYSKLLDSLEFPKLINEEIFYQSLHQAINLKEKILKDVIELNENRDNLIINLNKLNENYTFYKTELESLRQRKTQIPLPNLQIREMILRDLLLKENELPFVGELLKVNDKEREWEGAIERVLHNFGLSVLVPEEHYKRVSNYVDKTNLKRKISILQSSRFEKI